MGGGTFSLQQPGGCQHERSRANRSDKSRVIRLRPDEIKNFRILEQRIHAHAARDAEQIQVRTIRKRDIWDQDQACRRYQRFCSLSRRDTRGHRELKQKLRKDR